MINRLLLKLEPALVTLYRKILEPPVPNLRGDRHIEYSWIVANMTEGPGRALDFGTGPGWSWMGLVAARKGFHVTCVDTQPATWPYLHPRFAFVQGDIFELGFPDEHFNLIINCSSIEHVGLAHRYGVTQPRPDGDLEAMALLKQSLKHAGIMLLTIPVGRDRVFYPMHRVYGKTRLPLLIDGWEILNEEYWIKDDQNRWTRVDGAIALDREPLDRCYGLGLFVLRRPA